MPQKQTSKSQSTEKSSFWGYLSASWPALLRLRCWRLRPALSSCTGCGWISTDFDAQIAKLQKDKAMLEEDLSKTVAQIGELKTDIKSLRESLKPQKAEIKQTEKEIAKLEAKKAAAEAKAAEAAKKVEAEAVLKKLLASGMTADEILEKLK